MCPHPDPRTAEFAGNEQAAKELRARLAARGVALVDLMSSPGSGATALLEAELGLAAERGVAVAALTSDLATATASDGAPRPVPSGVPVRQVATDGLCHLEAGALGRYLDGWPEQDVRLLFVDNVGNLVCPASYDLGESLRVVLVSVAEGEDKPLKHPGAFARAHLVVVTESDLAEDAGFDREAFAGHVRRVNPGVEVVFSSVRSGEGVGLLLDRALAVAAGAAPHRPVPAASAVPLVMDGHAHAHAFGLGHGHPHTHVHARQDARTGDVAPRR
jgi:hydrogenase nickel incorporation protein HypB